MTFSIDFMVKVSLIHGETLLFAQTHLPQQSFSQIFSPDTQEKQLFKRWKKNTSCTRFWQKQPQWTTWENERDRLWFHADFCVQHLFFLRGSVFEEQQILPTVCSSPFLRETLATALAGRATVQQNCVCEVYFFATRPSVFGDVLQNWTNGLATT